MSNHDSPAEDDVTLGQLLDRASQAYDQVQSAPAPNDSTVQSTIASAISDLTLCSSLITRLGVLSPNETIEDITTNDLKCLAVEGLRGLLLTLKKTKGGSERKSCLESAKKHLLEFVARIESYEVIKPEDRSRYKGPLSTLQNPTLRRESKISQFKLEKELSTRLQEIRKRDQDRNRSTIFSTANHSSQNLTNKQKEIVNDVEDDDGTRRETYLVWLRFLYLKAYQELSSIELELDILGTGSQMEPLPNPRSTTTEAQKEEEEDLTWRLDRLSATQTTDGPLISPTGKVLRPFTILPSNKSLSGGTSTSDRIRLRSEVFRPDWNLPTMSIDEYLDEQESMGNFLTGGGKAQEGVETDGERTKREAQDDNLAGEQVEEELRKKAIEWDTFTDSHKKGEGNRLNRG